jgi:hypothetical protein
VTYRRNSGCKLCPSKTALAFTILTLVVVFTFLIYRFSSGMKDIPIDIRIGFQALQILGLYPSFLTKWPERLVQLFTVFSFTVNIFIWASFSSCFSFRISTLNCFLLSVHLQYLSGPSSTLKCSPRL